VAVGPFVLHAADAAGDPGHLNNGAAGRASEHRRQHDLAGRPADVRPLALVKLTVAAVGDPVEGLDRVDHLGEVLQQEVIPVQFHLDRLQHVHRMPFVEPIRQTNSRCP
jgi:hypothetical protein